MNTPANDRVGIYSVLTKLPIWATAIILYTMSLGVIYIGRDYFEGLPYQVAYSAQFGDMFLFGAILIANGILQRKYAFIPRLLNNGHTQWVLFLFCVMIGIIISAATLDTRSGQEMDVYHDVVIAPFILYCAITLLPVIFFRGKGLEVISTFCFIAIWAGLVAFDVHHDRINQRHWLTTHGVTLMAK